VCCGVTWGDIVQKNVVVLAARATLETLIPDFAKQTSSKEEKEDDDLEVSVRLMGQ